MTKLEYCLNPRSKSVKINNVDSEMLLMKLPVMHFPTNQRASVSCSANQVTAGRFWRDSVPVRPHLPPKLCCDGDSSCILMYMNYL